MLVARFLGGLSIFGLLNMHFLFFGEEPFIFFGVRCFFIDESDFVFPNGSFFVHSFFAGFGWFAGMSTKTLVLGLGLLSHLVIYLYVWMSVANNIYLGALGQHVSIEKSRMRAGLFWLCLTMLFAGNHISRTQREFLLIYAFNLDLSVAFFFFYLSNFLFFVKLFLQILFLITFASISLLIHAALNIILMF